GLLAAVTVTGASPGYFLAAFSTRVRSAAVRSSFSAARDARIAGRASGGEERAALHTNAVSLASAEGVPARSLHGRMATSSRFAVFLASSRNATYQDLTARHLVRYGESTA